MSVMNSRPFILSFTCLIVLLTSGWMGTSLAEDTGGLDMSALASIASTLGSNPQIMGMVSSLLNQNSANKPTNVGSGFDAANNGASSATSISDQTDPNQMGAQSADIGTAQMARSPVQQQARPTKETAAAPSTGGSSLSSLMSLLPSVLPALTQAGSKAQTPPPQPPPPAQAPAPQPLPVAQPMIVPQQVAVQAPIGQTPVVPPAAGATVAAAGGNPAQAVINQVLTAYASGQIPPEIIQLGLSGRVPPQIMELALSGQVPPQIIQMVITGQIPMTTINAFLGSMQSAPSRASSPASTATVAAAPGESAVASASSNSSSVGGGGGGIISTTRALVEAIFKPSANGSRKIMVPTLLGPLPIQIPNIPSMRQFGQMVGSSITNMASMVPF